MGGRSTTEQDERYRKRDVPLSLAKLTVADKPRDTEPKITGRERDNFLKSEQTYKNILTGNPSAERLERERGLFATAYTTTHKLVTPKEGAPYWWVETSYPKEKACMYLNFFKADGEVHAESNYHPKAHTSELLSNSTVLRCQYQYLLDKGIALGPVRKLRRHDVSNEQTNDTARVCFLLSAEMTTFPESWRMTWRPGDLMNTLLGTPNGRAAVFLVRDWGTDLGITGIESVTIDKLAPQGNRQTDLLITFTQNDGIEIPEIGSF